MGAMILKNLFQKLFNPAAKSDSSGPDFPKDGILWHEWNDVTKKLIIERDRPVLLFVANPDPTVSPFLKGVLMEMPRNKKLRALLQDYYLALMIPVESLPELFKDLGAGGRYNIAILSPAGLTPMAMIDPVNGKPEKIVETILKILEKLQELY